MSVDGSESRLGVICSIADDAGAATVGQEARAPACEHDQPVLNADQVEEMHQEPGHPGDEAGQLDSVQIGHGLRLADRRQIPLVEVAEGPALTPLESSPYHPSRIAALLNR